MRKPPEPPRQPAAQLEPVQVNHRPVTTNRRKISGMAIGKWWCFAASHMIDNTPANILALLLGCWRNPRHRHTIAPRHMRRITDDKNILISRHRKVGIDHHPATPITFPPGPVGQMINPDTRAPDDIGARNKFITDLRTHRGNVGNLLIDPDLDPDFFKRLAGIFR